MLRKGQKAASKEGKTVRKIQSNCHMITVEEAQIRIRPGIIFSIPYSQSRYPLIRTNPARPYNKTTGHFDSDSLTFENDRAKRKRKNMHTKRGAPSWVRLSILFLYCLIQAISFS